MSYFECLSVTLMLQCNLSKSDESTFFVLNVDNIQEQEPNDGLLTGSRGQHLLPNNNPKKISY